MADIGRLWQLLKGAASNEASKYGNSPRLADLLMRDRSTKGIRDYAGNVQQRGATLAGLLQGREPTDAQKALFSGLDPTTDEGAMNFALTFAGPMAKTANLAKLKIAEAMKAQGVPDQKIHADTGWFFGMADGKPRFEIPDNGVDFLPAKKWGAQSGNLASGRSAIDPIQNFMPHPELANAYPDINPMTIIDPKREGFGGSYLQEKDIMQLGVIKGAPMQPEGMPVPSTALHELQHAIQQREGFARGGSPGEFMQKPAILSAIEATAGYKNALAEFQRIAAKEGNDAAFKFQDNSPIFQQWIRAQQGGIDPIQAYERLAGEAEARLTQSRMSMTPAQRAASYPPSMFDVPVEQQLVRYK